MAYGVGMPVDKSTNQSVEKALTLLECFQDGRARRVGELAEDTGIGQSTVSRLLATLESAGIVERDPSSSLYFLGSELLTLAGVAINRQPVHRAARMIAQQLAARLELGVNVAILRGAELVYLCNFEGRLSPKSHTLMGERVPLHATSIGKAVLSGMSPAERDAITPRLRAYTTETITNRRDLVRELSLAAREGYATEIEEFVLGRASVAAPIRDRNGVVVAAISISGPRTVVDLDTRRGELGRIAVEAADRISTGLGFHGPAGP